MYFAGIDFLLSCRCDNIAKLMTVWPEAHELLSKYGFPEEIEYLKDPFHPNLYNAAMMQRLKLLQRSLSTGQCSILHGSGVKPDNGILNAGARPEGKDMSQSKASSRNESAVLGRAVLEGNRRGVLGNESKPRSSSASSVSSTPSRKSDGMWRGSDSMSISKPESSAASSSRGESSASSSSSSEGDAGENGRVEDGEGKRTIGDGHDDENSHDSRGATPVQTCANTASDRSNDSLPSLSRKRKLSDVNVDKSFSENDRLADVMSNISRCMAALPSLFSSDADLVAEIEVLDLKKRELQQKLEQQNEFHVSLEQGNATLVKQYSSEQEMNNTLATERDNKRQRRSDMASILVDKEAEIEELKTKAITKPQPVSAARCELEQLKEMHQKMK